MYTCPEIKNLEETPYYGRESFFGVEARLSHFVLQIKRRCQGPEVKRSSISIGGQSLILDKKLHF